MGRSLPTPPPLLVWAAVLADLIALLHFALPLLAWLATPAGLASLLVLNIALTLWQRR